MELTTGSLLTPEEASCYLLFHRSPGLSQAEIAREKGKSQSQISRILARAEAKVEEMKRLAEASGGDPSVVDQYLFQADSRANSRTLHA